MVFGWIFDGEALGKGEGKAGWGKNDGGAWSVERGARSAQDEELAVCFLTLVVYHFSGTANSMHRVLAKNMQS